MKVTILIISGVICYALSCIAYELRRIANKLEGKEWHYDDKNS